MLTNKPHYFFLILGITSFIALWAVVEIAHDISNSLIPPHEQKERTLPTFDTEPINQLKAAYYIGGGRVIDGCTLDSCWKLDSVIFQKYFIKSKHKENATTINQ